MAPTAAREVSPLGGVTTIRSFELPGTWYSVNDWFRGVVGWMGAPFASVCTETRCKNSIEPLGRTRTLQKSSGVPPRRSSMVPLPLGANWPSASRIGYSQNTIMGALAFQISAHAGNERDAAAIDFLADLARLLPAGR